MKNKLIIVLLLITCNCFSQSYWYLTGSVNLPPNRAQHECVLSGHVKIRGTDTLLVDITGKHDTVKIIGCDWLSDPEYKLGIIPYRTKAVIVFPVSLKSFDIDSFMFDSQGIGRKIPVISFFQNIDYKDKIFCKEVAQVLNSDSSEVHGLAVSYITIYSSAQTGSNLTACNTFFDVPTKDASAKWVDDVNGNDLAPGDGTEAHPYKTIAKGIATASTIVYCKTGDYDQAGTILTITKDVKRLGYCRLYNYGNYVCYLGAITITGLIVDGQNTKANGIYFSTSGATIDKLLMKGVTTSGIYDAAAIFTLKNSVLWPCASIVYNQGNMLYAYGNMLIGNSVSIKGFRNITTNTQMTLKWNKYSGTFDAPIKFAATGDVVATSIRTLGERGTYTANAAYVTAADVNNFSVKGCKFTMSGNITNFTATSSIIKATIYIHDNTFNITNGSFIIAFADKNCEIYNNIIINTGPGNIFRINSTTNQVLCRIYNNRIEIKNNANGSISFGDNALIIANKMNGYFYNNVILAAGVWGYTSPVNSHGVCIWSNDSFQIINNIIDGYLFPIVLKGNNLNYPHCIVQGNLLMNGRMIVKGIHHSKTYNNVFYNSHKSTCNYASTVYDDLVTHSHGNEVKNNIFINTVPGYANFQLDVGDSIVSDYNRFYDASNLVGYIPTVGTYSLAQWQTYGYDLSSTSGSVTFSDTINYKFYPVPAITGGVDLGATYDDGLDISTNWGNSTTIPVIVTKQQTGSWHIGAYKQ